MAGPQRPVHEKETYEIFDSRDFFITADVGSGHGQSRPHDVVRIRRALDETGHGRSPATPSPRYDRSIHDNIIGFQDDFGLEKDGWLEPGGPTETALNLALDAKRAGGKEAMEAVRGPFATMNRDGFQFLPNANRFPDKTHNWLAPYGNKLTDAQRDDAIFSKAVGNRIKRIPANDPTPHMNRPNPIAPPGEKRVRRARNGERAGAKSRANPGSSGTRGNSQANAVKGGTEIPCAVQTSGAGIRR